MTEPPSGTSATSVTVRFTPQAWVRDQAIEVDAEGPVTFEIPAADAQDAEGDWLPSHDARSDRLHDHPNAPDWIRAWRGPYEIELEPPDPSI